MVQHVKATILLLLVFRFIAGTNNIMRAYSTCYRSVILRSKPGFIWELIVERQ